MLRDGMAEQYKIVPLNSLVKYRNIRWFYTKNAEESIFYDINNMAKSNAN